MCTPDYLFVSGMFMVERTIDLCKIIWQIKATITEKAKTYFVHLHLYIIDFRIEQNRNFEFYLIYRYF